MTGVARPSPHRLRSVAQAGAVGLLLAAITAGITAALAPIAAAAPGQAAWPTFLRAGPGQEYAAIDEVGRGQALDVRECAAGWCRVVFGAAAGFVQQEVIAGPAAAAAAPAAPPAPGDCFTTEQAGYPKGEKQRFCPR